MKLAAREVFMLRAEEIEKITHELKNLASALDTCTDGRIREVIEIRIEERALRLRQLKSSRPGRPQQSRQQHPPRKINP
jgi:hypothetical protein